MQSDLLLAQYESITEETSVYIHTEFVLTEPDIVIPVSVPSSVSVAVAPSSEYVPPSGTIMTPLPLREIIGTSPRITFTVRFTGLLICHATSVYE